MDPAFRSVLLVLLKLLVEQDAPDPMRQDPPDREPPYPPGSLGDYRRQLEPVSRHHVWPENLTGAVALQRMYRSSP